MNTIILTTHIGPNGRLYIDLPTDLQNPDVEIALTFQPLPPHNTWFDNFFTEIIGGWAGEPLQQPNPLPDEKCSRP
ncbi:MAG: hypothetical protein R6U67_10165 [Sodalinema sp.]|uniref:hypothetical protein n=1 Tax=Sodalinema sp. TaxID=3080550 RepID=UPI00120C2AEE|nr:MAG: hypothetical protein EYR95_03150 [Phormidium sp. SL48-SHIP]